MCLKSPEIPKEIKVSRNIRAQSNLIIKSFFSKTYQKPLEDGFCR